MTMQTHALRLAAIAAALSVSLSAQAPQEQDPVELRQERASAEKDVPQLVDVLGIKPGATIADIGSGGGAMSVVLGHWNTGGRVLATDVTEHALRWTRQYVKKEGLTNVTVIEGAAAATNLPAACCDAAFMRNVYHHVTEPAAFNKSLYATMKPGGRLAIIDAVGRQGSEVPAGVPANRGGHGIPPSVVVDELKAAGFTHLRTIDGWPPGQNATIFLALFQK